MKEVLFDQMTAQGNIIGILRIIGDKIYFKVNNNEYSKKMLRSLEEKGATINYSANKDWVQISIFNHRGLIKLGEHELDFENSSVKEIEEFICKFYSEQYKKLNFNVRVI